MRLPSIRNLVYLDKKALARLCSNLTIELGHKDACKLLMVVRRDLQEETARLARTKEPEVLQLKAVQYAEMILKWVKEWYMLWATKEVLRKNPEISANPDSVKYRTRAMWEKYVKSHNY